MSCFQMTTDEHMIEWHNYPKGRIGHLYIVAGFFSKRKKSKLEQHGVLSAFYLTLKRNRLECRLQIAGAFIFFFPTIIYNIFGLIL